MNSEKVDIDDYISRHERLYLAGECGMYSALVVCDHITGDGLDCWTINPVEVIQSGGEQAQDDFDTAPMEDCLKTVKMLKELRHIRLTGNSLPLPGAKRMADGKLAAILTALYPVSMRLWGVQV